MHPINYLISLMVIQIFYYDQVVHVVDTAEKYGEIQDPRSYMSLFSTTPGNLKKEVEQINEGFVCGRDKVLDFVTFSVKYGCLTNDDIRGGWSKSDIPVLHVDSDTEGNDRTTQISIDTKVSTRLSLAINIEEIEDFLFKGTSRIFVLFFLVRKTNLVACHMEN